MNEACSKDIDKLETNWRPIKATAEEKQAIKKLFIKCILEANKDPCTHEVINTNIEGYGYCTKYCVKCFKTLELFRKLPDLIQKYGFFELIDEGLNHASFSNDSKIKQKELV